MDIVKPAISGRSRAASFPLVVAYGAVPLGTAFVRGMSDSNYVSATAPWLLLAGMGALFSMRNDKPGEHWGKGLVFKATLFLLMVIGLFLYSPDIRNGLSDILPYLHESTPLIFLFFSMLWVTTFGLPDRSDFQRFGALLSVFCIINLAVEIAAYQAIPTIRWIGNADMLAGLLLVSLCASLKPGSNEGGSHEPDQGKRLWRGLIMVGVLTCFSRTGFFAAAWVVLCFGRGAIGWRILYASLCALLLGFTFFLPPTPSDSVRYIDYWLWVESLRLFAETPELLLTGFSVPEALPINFPTGMSAVWQVATGESTMSGAYIHQVPSFWLRLTLSWGIFAPLMLLAFVFALLFRRLTRLGAGLTAALFAQGMTTPLLFDPAMAVSISTAFLLAISAQSPEKDRTEKVAQTDPLPVQPADPVKEWDLRPQ